MILNQQDPKYVGFRASPGAQKYIDDQTKQIKELKDEQRRKDKLFEQHKTNSWKLVEQIKALEEYVTHKPKCSILLEIGSEDKCTCGFDKLNKHLKK